MYYPRIVIFSIYQYMMLVYIITCCLHLFIFNLIVHLCRAKTQTPLNVDLRPGYGYLILFNPFCYRFAIQNTIYIYHIMMAHTHTQYIFFLQSYSKYYVTKKIRIVLVLGTY